MPQDTLHLTAEVGVSGRVHDVDLRVLPPDGGVLGENRDAPLLFERIRIHHTFFDDLVFRKAPACRSILSTRVVFPWSTCAMMATLRISIALEDSKLRTGIQLGQLP